MALVAAAVVPHSPLLLPSIAKDHVERSAGIRTAMIAIGQDIYAAQPDVLLVLTPHGPQIHGTHVFELADQLHGQLIEFGELTASITVPGAVGFMHRVKEAAEDADLPVILQTQVGLDYGVTIPWLTMWSEPVPWSVAPLTIAPREFADLITLGEMLREYIQSRPERVALLATGDTQRRPSKMSDADRRPTADERMLSEAISKNDVGRLSKMQSEDICLRAPLITMLACLHGLPYKGAIQMFDVPLTVGQLVADFKPV